MNSTNKAHELRNRFIDFAIKVIRLTKKLPKNPENIIIIHQIIRSATSISANYAESMFGLTKADFIHCLNICKKETAETLNWLEVILKLNPNLSSEIKPLIDEGESYLRIFIASVKTAQKNK